MGVLRPVPVVAGGTGATDASNARTNLNTDVFTPGDAANWDPDPTTKPGALDQLAQRMASVEALGAGASDGAPAYSTASADAQPANLTGRVMDCTNSALVITLPATPSANHLVGAAKGAGATTNRCYVRPAGSGKIMAAQQLLSLGTAYEALQLQYIDSTIGWVLSRVGQAALTCPIPGIQFLMLPNATWTQSGGLVSSVKDHSGNGLNATESTNKPTYSGTGINSGPALVFNGTSTVLSTASPVISSSTSFWVAMTIIADTVDGNVRALVSQDSRVTGPHRTWLVSYNTTDTGFTVFDQSTGGNIRIAGSVLSTATKYTLVATYDGGSSDAGLNLYINNSAASSRATAGTFVAMDDFTEPTRLGASYGSGALERFFAGKMNFAAIGTGVPTAAEISALYTFGNSL